MTLLALVIAVLVSGLRAAGTDAHEPEILVNSDPPDGVVLEQSPTRVMAWFNTQLDARLSTLQVVDINDQQVDNGDGRVELNNLDYASMIVSLPDLPEGVYIVRWTVVTAIDGDLVDGVFTFGVSHAEAPPGENSTAQAPNPDRNGGWPLGLIIGATVGLLLSVTIGVVLYARSARSG